MRNIRILDCTLRDGGCVNDFNFGNKYMNQILNSIEQAGIEIVELGYIDEKSGSEKDRTKYCNDRVIIDNFLLEKKQNIKYVAMIDYGKYNPDLLQPCSSKTIDGIRLAFHKKNRKDMIEWGKKILDKGYMLFIQPMTCLNYSDAEMLDLITDVNDKLKDASAFYIVDSFGEMRLKDMERIANLVDHNLISSMPMGLHSHNNLQLSYSNAVTLLNFQTQRELIFDSSIMGMGKGAGNMNTELFAEHLNVYGGKNYDIVPLLDVIDTVINQIKENYSWGYSVEYYLSAKNHCTPSYAAHFYKKHMLSIKQVSELLSMLSEDKKISFDKQYADEMYYKYNSNMHKDGDISTDIIDIFKDKDILILAPGKSVLQHKKELMDIRNRENVVSIALNNVPAISVDYAFVTKLSSYNLVEKLGIPCIVSSNIPVEQKESMIVDYDSITKYDDGKSDNSTIMLMNVLRKCDVKSVMLAGFDGFSTDINENYYDDELKRPIDRDEVNARNKLIKAYLSKIKNEMDIIYVTRSIYQQ